MFIDLSWCSTDFDSHRSMMQTDGTLGLTQVSGTNGQYQLAHSMTMAGTHVWIQQGQQWQMGQTRAVAGHRARSNGTDE